MAEKPILMAGAMVRATIEGRKTVTRRLIQQASLIHGECTDEVRPFGDGSYYMCARDGTHMTGQFRPPYEVGDQMWVRETWNVWFASRDGDDWWPARSIPKDDPREDEDARAPSAVDYPVCSTNGGYDAGKGPWRPSIHMPRWASRLTLPVIDVRAERLQDITEEDAKAEGIAPACGEGCCWHGAADTVLHYGPRDAFAHLWNSLAKPRMRWADNPWVWRVEFPAQAGRQVDGGGDGR